MKMNLDIDPRTVLGNATQAASQSGKKERQLQSLRESTREFETLFINEMFKAMRKTVPRSELFPENTATGFFREILDMETARAATRGEGIGIASRMYEQMSKLVTNSE